MFLITDILSALIARATTGKGQVVDVAMVDGVADEYAVRIPCSRSMDR